MSSKIFDCAIVGGGVSGAFAALRLAQQHPGCKAILFEFGRPPAKRRRNLEGWLGCFPNSDGKLYTGDLDNVLTTVDGRRAKPAYNWVMDTFGEVNPMKLVSDHLPTAAAQRRIQGLGFDIMKNPHYQWRPDSIHMLSRLIADQTDEKIQFSFDNEVHSIVKKKGVFHIKSALGDFQCKKVILCAGRSGWRWVNKLYSDLGLTVQDDYAQYGVRVEISSQYLKDFNRSHCTLTRPELELGPFSWAGSVIPEDHADLVISSFRSNEERWKTDKVSFSLLASKYFKGQGCYQTERLAKLAYLLSNDRIGKERIKMFAKESNELYLVPEYRWLWETFQELDGMIPNLINRGYFHTPNISPMASQIKLSNTLESELDGLYVCGESGGIKGILGAAITGAICADSVSK